MCDSRFVVPTKGISRRFHEKRLAWQRGVILMRFPILAEAPSKYIGSGCEPPGLSVVRLLSDTGTQKKSGTSQDRSINSSN